MKMKILLPQDYEKMKNLFDNGFTRRQISQIMNLHYETVVQKIRAMLKDEKSVKKNKKSKDNIINLISVRMLYYCDDIPLLGLMLADEIKKQTLKEVYIPKRLKQILTLEKIKKIENMTKILCG